MIGKTNEWHLPLWLMSLDLRKAFDRIQFGPLFAALREQGVPEGYIHLLGLLYKDQKGTVNGSAFFDILRGVKQGDVISSMLFNAGLETAFRSWKLRLGCHGFLLKEHTQRLTNTRYADDVMLYAKSAEEITEMTELLVEELSKVGLQLNGTKTKILTTSPVEFDFVDIAGDMVEIVSHSNSHKYLGRYLPGDLLQRSHTEIGHRIQSAWCKFGKYVRVLMNKIFQSNFD